MSNERQKALEQLQKELLEDDLLEDSEEITFPDNLLDDLPTALFDNSNPAEPELSPEEILWEEPKEVIPAFEDPEEIHEPAEPMEYRNYSNDYGRDDEESAMKKKTQKQKREDNWQIILMAIASFLCLGIIGVLIYWMEVFLK